jgi:hypothetical protein
MNSVEAPRPMSLGEILDRTVQLYRGRFLVYLGISIIPTGVLLIFGGSIFLALAWLGVWSGTSKQAPVNSPAAIAIAVIIIGVISLVALAAMLGLSSLSTAAINHAAAGALAGKRPTIRGSFGEAWRRGWMYLGLYVLQALIVWIAPIGVWSFALVFMTGIAAGMGRSASAQSTGALVGLLTLFGFMAVAGFALWMLLCVSLAFPGCVVEKIDAGNALKRSFRLSKGTRGRIFVLYLLGAVLGWICSMVATVIFAIVVALIPGMNSPQHAQTMGMTVIFVIYGSSFAMQAFTKPVYAIALMLFYYDQRIRNEGFDIEWMMERAGLVAGVATVANARLIPAVNGEAIAAGSGEPFAVADGGQLAVVNAESGQEPGGESIAIPVELEAATPERETLNPSHLQVATETTETTAATQPEDKRQE